MTANSISWPQSSFWVSSVCHVTWQYLARKASNYSNRGLKCSAKKLPKSSPSNSSFSTIKCQLWTGRPLWLNWLKYFKKRKHGLALTSTDLRSAAWAPTLRTISDSGHLRSAWTITWPSRLERVKWTWYSNGIIVQADWTENKQTLSSE